MTEKILILDRDGVINFDSEDYIKSPEECIPIPGSLEAIALLNQKGYQVVVATNQSGIARGYYNLQTLDAIHQKLHEHAGKVNAKIDKFYFCPHGPDDNCDCRKPKPGLIHQIQQNYPVTPSTYFVGDSYRDIESAIAGNCTPVLVKTGNGEKTLSKHMSFFQNHLVFDTLADFANYI